MKILIYTGFLNLVSKSGIGEAIRHQIQILNIMDIKFTKKITDSYDIVHINTILPDSLLMSKWAKFRKKKVIYYGHSTMEDFKNSFIGSNLLAPLFKRWITLCYNSGDIVITPTEYSKAILESYNLKPKVYSLSNGVDIDFFSNDICKRDRFRKKQNIKENEKVIISVGHYIDRKGIIDFVELAKALPEYQFYWFGYTNMSLVTKDVKDAVNTQLDNLHFPGYINRDELLEAYNGCDLFLFMTKEETEGIVILEALSCQTPIIVRDIPIYKEWLPENEAVYKARNNNEFEERINQLLKDELPSITNVGYEVACELGLGNVGNKLKNIYEMIC